jgi:hypothetical protein
VVGSLSWLLSGSPTKRKMEEMSIIVSWVGIRYSLQDGFGSTVCEVHATYWMEMSGDVFKCLLVLQQQLIALHLGRVWFVKASAFRLRSMSVCFCCSSPCVSSLDARVCTAKISCWFARSTGKSRDFRGQSVIKRFCSTLAMLLHSGRF